MTREWPIALLCLGAALVGGCTNLVNITSKPTGARVRIDGVDRGRTPLEILVTWSPWRYNRITLEHPGYHPFSTVLRRTFRWPGPPTGWDKSKWDATLGTGVIYGGLTPLVLLTQGGGPSEVIVFPVLTFGAFRGPVAKQHFVLAPRLRGPGSEAPPTPDEGGEAAAGLPSPESASREPPAGGELPAPGEFVHSDGVHLDSPHVEVGAVVTGVSF